VFRFFLRVCLLFDSVRTILRVKTLDKAVSINASTLNATSSSSPTVAITYCMRPPVSTSAHCVATSVPIVCRKQRGTGMGSVMPIRFSVVASTCLYGMSVWHECMA
jgi:hypothetical protein